jgi:hypothetical protein
MMGFGTGSIDKKLEQGNNGLLKGVRHGDGSVCYVIGVCKDIRRKIQKNPGDRTSVKIVERA